MTRPEKAIELRKQGYNCAQSVICAFTDILDADEQTVFKSAQGFGLGMGGGQCVCGAVSGAVMACSLKSCSGKPGDVESLLHTLDLSKQITEAFQKRNGTLICKELKGTETGNVIRTCPDCIIDAVEIAEKIMAADKAE